MLCNKMITVTFYHITYVVEYVPYKKSEKKIKTIGWYTLRKKLRIHSVSLFQSCFF